MQPTVKANIGKDSPKCYHLICRIIWMLSPKYTLHGTENLPEESCVLVGNHCQMYGPIASELYLERPHYIWCIGEMMNRKEVPAYAFQDFWSGKPKSVRWFYKLLSYVIAPLAEYVFTHAHTIPVRHDARVMTTFRTSVEKLSAGADIVIFPEKAEAYNGILWQFQEHFVDLAKLYHRRTGKAVCFVPMYTAPRLSGIHFGEPVRFDPEAPEDEERARICKALLEAISDLASALPEHTVVPYPNIPKNQYPKNTDRKTAPA
ncbi:MAG: hypothetical protein IKG23_11650 [Clostridia bacterium]|nr:hypothetical protein [Clostridia bacterium]